MPDTYSIKPQIYNISHANTNIDFVTKKDTFCDTLHIHLNSIHFKDADISKLPDFVGVQQLHSSYAFVEVILGSAELNIFIICEQFSHLVHIR